MIDAGCPDVWESPLWKGFFLLSMLGQLTFNQKSWFKLFDLAKKKGRLFWRGKGYEQGDELCLKRLDFFIDFYMWQTSITYSIIWNGWVVEQCQQTRSGASASITFIYRDKEITSTKISERRSKIATSFLSPNW